MFARIFALLPLAVLVAANNVNECNTSNQYCCDNAFQSGQANENDPIFGLVDAVIGVTAQAGVTCTLGVTDCTQQPVCCSNVNQNGLINVGCSPLNIA